MQFVNVLETAGKFLTHISLCVLFPNIAQDVWVDGLHQIFSQVSARNWTKELDTTGSHIAVFCT